MHYACTLTTTIKYQNRALGVEYQGTSIADLHLTSIPARGFRYPELQRNVPCNGVRGGLKGVYWRLGGDKAFRRRKFKGVVF